MPKKRRNIGSLNCGFRLVCGFTILEVEMVTTLGATFSTTGAKVVMRAGDVGKRRRIDFDRGRSGRRRRFVFCVRLCFLRPGQGPDGRERRSEKDRQNARDA